MHDPIQTAVHFVERNLQDEGFSSEEITGASLAKNIPSSFASWTAKHPSNPHRHITLFISDPEDAHCIELATFNFNLTIQSGEGSSIKMDNRGSVWTITLLYFLFIHLDHPLLTSSVDNLSTPKVYSRYRKACDHGKAIHQLLRKLHTDIAAREVFRMSPDVGTLWIKPRILLYKAAFCGPLGILWQDPSEPENQLTAHAVANLHGGQTWFLSRENSGRVPNPEDHEGEVLKWYREFAWACEDTKRKKEQA